MKQLKLNLVLILAVGVFPVALFGQTGRSLQRIDVTSVTITLDSVSTPAQATAVKDLITAYSEVKDFDIKLHKCNFTLDNTGNALDMILDDLDSASYGPQVYAIRVNETFTHVPEENCEKGSRNFPDMTEEEVRQRGIERGGGR